MSFVATRVVWLGVVLAPVAGCCFGGEVAAEETVLAQADLSCGTTTAHVARTFAVTDSFSGITETVRSVTFGDGVTLQPDSSRLGAWRPTEELPEHVRSPRLTDGASAWILSIPGDATYRCAVDHLAEIETVFDEQPLVIFHAPQTDVVATFRAHAGTADLSLRLGLDGELFAQFQEGPTQSGLVIGQMVREPSGRVLALASDAGFSPSLPPEFRGADSIVAVARDEAGRTVLERFPSQTRPVGVTELLGLQ